MFKLNLKIALRNLWKNKGFTAINILGLAAGLSGVLFILLFVNHERSYDHWHPDLAKVYQLQELDIWDLKDGKVTWQDYTDSRLATIIKSTIPQVREVVHFDDGFTQSVVLDGKEPVLQTDIAYGSANFFKVFPFQFIYGDAANVLKNPGNIVIKESFSKKFFDNDNPVGKTIKLNEQNWTKPETYTITGVVADAATPSTVDFSVLILEPDRVYDDRFNSSSGTFVQLSADDASSVNASLQQTYLTFRHAWMKKNQFKTGDFIANGQGPQVRLMPYQELHQQPLYGENWFSFIKPVILLVTLLMVIAIINFVNMFTAQAAKRAKEVGVRKVMGANRPALIRQFLFETGMQCVAALIISVVALEVLLPYLNTLFNLSLHIWGEQSLLIGVEMIALVVLVTLLAGFYPAISLSAFLPYKVIKGNYLNGRSGSVLRTGLVGVQFIVAVAFCTGIMIVNKQVNFMEKRDPGFTANGVINLVIPFKADLAARIKRIPGVNYVGSNNGMIGRNQNMDGSYTFKNDTRVIKTVLVNLEGLQALDARILSGRLFDARHAQDEVSSLIINESLSRAYGGNMIEKFITVNDSIPSQVVGVIKDIQVAGFDERVEPTVYTAATVNATGYPNKGVNYVVKFDPKQQKGVLAALEKIWKAEYPAFPFTFNYVQDDFNQLFIAHQRFKKLMTIFSILSISLSIIGLFALAAFMTRQRTREIAVRKVLAANDSDILLMLNKGYFRLMVVCNIITWPLIYIAASHWLTDFAYRIDLPYTPFILAFIASLICTIVTVSLQVKHAVRATPVDALKYE